MSDKKSSTNNGRSRQKGVLIKTSFHKEERICKIAPSEDQMDFEESFEHLCCFISRMYGIEKGHFTVQYVDEEFDLITMMDYRDLEDAIESAKIRKNCIPKVFVRLIDPDTPTSMPSSEEFWGMRRFGNMQWCEFLENVRANTHARKPLFTFLNGVISNLQDGVPIDEALSENLRETLQSCQSEILEQAFCYWQMQQQHFHSHSRLAQASGGARSSSLDGSPSAKPCKTGRGDGGGGAGDGLDDDEKRKSKT